MIHLALFCSGSGSNAQQIMEYFLGNVQIKVALVVSSNPEAYVLQRAAGFGIPTIIISKEDLKSEGDLLPILKNHHIDYIILAGFIWKIPSKIVDTFTDKILNIHPSLLPKFGGKGMYGIKVHEAVKLQGEKESGMTIHLVNHKYDDGRILYQDICQVFAQDTPEDISQRVLKLEHFHYSRVIDNYITSRELQQMGNS